MFVSVIVPVYNAEKYVREAVESALSQPETAEVILIEDASPDRSLQVCEELCREYLKVRLLRHKDGKNHGAGASRNLGILNAKHDFIAFLDADDFFLPARFSVPKQLFETNPEIEGVYEAVGFHTENRVARPHRANQDRPELTTMTARLPPSCLFEAQAPVGDSGYCPTGGWIVKRSIFDKTGLFDEHLRLHQDTVMFVKFAAVGQMQPGRLDRPVAMRRVHGYNRISAPRSDREVFRNRIMMWGALWKWGTTNLDITRRQILLKRLVDFANKPSKSNRLWLINRLRASGQLLLLLARFPQLCFEPVYWRMILSNLFATIKSFLPRTRMVQKL